MTDQGLSIFDEDPGEDATAAADEDATRVMPPVPAEQPERPKPAAEPTKKAPVLPPASAPAAPAAAPAPAAATRAAAGGPIASPAGFPVVRRGGYDKDAVDTRLRQLTTEKSGLSSSLSDSERRVLQLEEQVEHLQEDLSERQKPSYAGLGGRAAAMLRLAEEEAAEVRETALQEARDIRDQATRDAHADPCRRVPRGRGHAAGADQGARGEPRPAAGRRRAGAGTLAQRGRRLPRRRRSARPPRCCWPRPRRATSCAPPRGARPSSSAPPRTARSRRPAGCSRWRRSGWPRRPPTTTPPR